MSDLDDFIEKIEIREILEKLMFENITDIGDEYSCKCIFHNDNHNSFSINKKTKLWYCFAESIGGNLIQLITKALGISYNDALKTMGAPDEISGYESIKTTESLFKVLKKDCKRENNEIKKYDSLISMFDDRMPDYFIQRGFNKDIWDFFHLKYSFSGAYSGRIVVPIFNEENKIEGLTSRAINNNIVPKWKHSLGFKTNENLFNINNAKHYTAVYITEGPFDVFRFYQAGFLNSLSIFGSRMSEYQARKIVKNFNHVCLVFDNDEAGIKCLQTAINLLSGQVSLYYILLPLGNDPGDFEAQILNKLVKKNAKPAYEFDFEFSEWNFLNAMS